MPEHKPVQRYLLQDLESPTAEPPSSDGQTGFRDTAFMQNRAEPLHRWVPWVAGFSASFVRGIFDTHISAAPQTVTVLDPFCGVGTTLVEAIKRGYDAIGFEINPYAALASQVKVECITYDLSAVEKTIDRFYDFMESKVGDKSASPRSKPPTGFRSRQPFFSDGIQRQVLFVRDFIGAQKKPWMRSTLRVALGSVMVAFSNYSYEPSLSTRSAGGKAEVVHADVGAMVGSKLVQMAKDMALLQEQLSALSRAPRAMVHRTSCLSGDETVPKRTVDLLITSPPYLNNYHYVRNTRPHLFWLDMVHDPAELKEFEGSSFGKFWQTVRSGPDMPLQADYPELHEVIERVRACNEAKGTYGGRGWANYAATYFNDCARFCRIVAQWMKPAGTAVVVIGNNILQGIEIRTDEFFAGIAERHGLDVVGLHRVREKRTGSSIVNSSVRAGVTRKPTGLYETAVQLRARA